MTASGYKISIPSRLKQAIADGVLPASLSHRAGQLVTRLDRPVRISVVGFPGAGKSSVLELFLGESIHASPHTPILEIKNGRICRETFLDADSIVLQETPAAGQSGKRSHPVRCLKELPLTQLVNKTVIEINLPAVDDDAGRLLDWMAATTDIVIWCTRDFTAREAQLWSTQPDRMKDHGFLVLTTSDTVRTQGNLDQIVEDLRIRTAGEFLELFPVATKSALAARRNDHARGSSPWVESGAEALMCALEDQIENGRAADLDFAEMLLAKYKLLPNGRMAAGQQHASLHADGPARMPRRSLDEQSTATRLDVLKNALSLLDGGFQEPGLGDECPETCARSILRKVVQCAEELRALFAESGSEDLKLSDLKDLTQNNADVLSSLQNDETIAAAVDAVTALLQVKKEVSEVVYT